MRAPSDVLAFSLLNLCNSANAAGVRSANGAVRTLVIVVLSELRELLPGIFQRRKPLHVQTLVPQSAIETLDECVLHRPAWPDETQLDPVLDYLHLQGATAELAAVVHCNARRQTTPLRSCLLQPCTIFIPVMDRSASSHTHSRVNWSTAVRMRNERPVCHSQSPCSNTHSLPLPSARLGVDDGRFSSAAWCAQSTAPPRIVGRCA